MLSASRFDLNAIAHSWMSLCCKGFVTFLEKFFTVCSDSFLTNYLTSPAHLARLFISPTFRDFSYRPLRYGPFFERIESPLLRRPHVKTLESLVYSLKTIILFQKMKCSGANSKTTYCKTKYKMQRLSPCVVLQ
jgi:hypothetical protein